MNKILNTIKKYFKRENPRSILMLIKITVLILTLSFSPTVLAQDLIEANASFSPNIVFTKNESIVSLTNSNQIKFEYTESNYDKAQRELSERAKSISTTNRNVATRESRSYQADPDQSTKRELVKKAANAYGIDWKVLEAVWEVESGKSWDTSRGSYAGARGPMQFMPGTWRAYGVDANNDGVKDINSAEDAVFGAAHLLARSGLDEGYVDKALFNYNHAKWYVEKVKRIASSIVE